ncbi:hypothetical protein OG900_01855 [Streptomyces sp. NBC_00433]
MAAAVYDGVEKDQEDIFPDPMSAAMAEGWRNGAAKAFGREAGGARPGGACRRVTGRPGAAPPYGCTCRATLLPFAA